MSWNWEAILSGAISGGLFSSALTIFVAPHINWGVEKKRLLRADRQRKIQSWFEDLDADKGSPVLTRDIYPQVKPYLTQATIGAIESYTWSEWKAGRYEKNEEVRSLLLSDLAALQRKWELV